MKGLTKRQREVLDYIESYIESNDYSPSYRNIQEHFGFSSLGTVYNYIKVLKRKNVVQGEKNSSRSLTPTNFETKKGSAEIELPFLGYISANVPIDTFPQIQTASVPQTLVPFPARTYVLRARGDSLSDEFIADGDLILVEARQEAKPGETVLALIHHNETQIKKYYPEGQYVRLESRMQGRSPLVVRNEEVVVQGIIVGLIRFYE